MLDTNICIYLIKKKPPEVLNHLTACPVGDVGISSITLAELEYGVSDSKNIDKNQQALSEFMLPLEVAPFDNHAAEIYGRVRADLERKGQVIGAMDMLIGSHALSLGVTLVTNNLKEFRRIEGLKNVNWAR